MCTRPQALHHQHVSGANVQFPTSAYNEYDFVDDALEGDPARGERNMTCPTKAEAHAIDKKALKMVQDDFAAVGAAPSPSTRANASYKYFWRPDRRKDAHDDAGMQTDQELAMDELAASTSADQNPNETPEVDFAEAMDPDVCVEDAVPEGDGDDGDDNVSQALDSVDSPTDAEAEGAGQAGTGGTTAGRQPLTGLTHDKTWVPTSDGSLVAVNVDKVVADYWARNFEDHLHTSSDRQLRYQGMHRCRELLKESDRETANGTAGDAELIGHGDDAILAFEHHEHDGEFIYYLATLDGATKLGKPRRNFTFVWKGCSSNLLTYWHYYVRLARTDGETPARDQHGVGLPIDLTDSTTRYTRDRQGMMQTIHVNPPGTPASEANNLLPIVRGVNLIPCDPQTCCGRCCTIAQDDLADLAAWDQREDTAE